jgi:hypothetical protein
MVAAIAASNGVLPLVGGMALSDTLLLGEALLGRTLLAPKDYSPGVVEQQFC